MPFRVPASTKSAASSAVRAHRFVRSPNSRRQIKNAAAARASATSSSPPRPTLVGPPDSVSNLRPVIYEGDTAPSEPIAGSVEASSSSSSLSRNASQYIRTTSSPAHPYSLDEFDGDPSNYQWRLERKQLDAYNHAFWTDSNTRFNKAREELLASLPADASPDYKEGALSNFYSHWLSQERNRLRTYADEWNRRNAEEILLAARAAIRRFRARFFDGGR